MAEFLAVAGIASNIVQLVDFGGKILRRLDEFHSKLDDVPESFQHIKVHLPLLLEILKDTQHDIGTGVIKRDTEKALQSIVNGGREHLESLDAIIDKLLPLPRDSWAKRSKKALLSLKEESNVNRITSALGSYVQTLTFYHSAVRSTLNPLKDDKLVKIRQWLSAPDPSTNYQKGLRLRQADTGLWFLESEQYVKWKANPASFIWLHGIPGCGKTILSSTVIEDILRHCANDPARATAYFYFDFNDSLKQTSESMIKSLVTQLSQQCIRIPPLLDSLFGSSNNGHQQPTTEGLLEALRQMSEEIPATHIILDALDECTGREELMVAIETIAGWQLESLHVIVTSRKERDIDSCLESLVERCNIIPLRSAAVDEDIRKYVQHRIAVDKKLKKWQSSEMQKEIEVALMQGAHGMFRWAVCQLDSLGNCVSRAMLRRSLERLPPTLDKTYERILCAVHEDHSTQALRILRWLAFSLRPLSLEEVAEVVAVDPESCPVLDKDEVLEDPLDALNICASLVTISSQANVKSDYENDDEPEELEATKVIALAHYSVKEYLVSDRIRKGPANIYSLQESTSNIIIANSCIGYLLQFQNAESFSKGTIESHKLARYSAEFWTRHARLYTSEEASTHKLVMELFSIKNGAYLNWIRIYNLDPHSSSGTQIDYVASPLYYASLLGLTEIVRCLLPGAGANVNARGGYYNSALQAASAGGHKTVVKLLLDAGADINAQCGRYGNALQAASDHGHEAVVRLLLDAGCDVNAPGGFNGKTFLFTLLACTGPGSKIPRGFQGNALQAASYHGRKAVVKLLLDAGADVNANVGDYDNALQAASAGGHEAVVKLLLDAGADANAQNGHFESPLGLASAGGHEAMVKLLLDAGANANGYFESPLGLASAGGHEAVVKLLLDAGADANGKDGYFESPLGLASAGGHEAVVKLLLDAGADVNAQGGFYGSTLQAASAGGHETVVKLLLDVGADINAQCGHFGNALQAALDQGHKAVVKLLLDVGAVRQD